LVRYWGLAGFGVGALVPFLDRRVAVMMVGAYLGLVIVGTLSRAALTWRARDPVGMWVFLAFTPMAVAATVLVGERLGMLPTSWFSQYGVMVGFSIEMPLLLVALNLRSRERHSVEARAQALISQDALTGLLSAPIFQDRFKQIVARSRKIREPAAVMYIDLVNYRYIKKTWGVAVAEQSLLRSVIKLRRILRDVDTVGRIDEARFGVILEGVASRGPVTELAARLIAAGLMPLTGLKPEVILQFHVAVALLSEYPGSDADIGEALTTLMQRMGPRSRRPIRFLALEPTQASPLEPTPDDSSR
jgi:diguanylate cyclase (GGDEF)-like protein